MTLGALLLALHAIGAALWVGGMFFALVVFRPAISGLDAPSRLAVQDRVFRRFFAMVWIVVLLMAVTGCAMEYLFYDGFGSSPWPMQAMTVLGAAMAAVFVAIVRGPARSLRRGMETSNYVRAGGAAQQLRVLVATSLLLGLVTIAVAMVEY